MADRQGIEIDYCPACRWPRGVWLDRGELDKLIERSVADQVKLPRVSGEVREDKYRGGYPDPYRDQKGYPRKKKSGFLGEFFDFD